MSTNPRQVAKRLRRHLRRRHGDLYRFAWWYLHRSSAIKLAALHATLHDAWAGIVGHPAHDLDG